MALDFAPTTVLIITQFFLLCSVEHNKKNWLFHDSVKGAQTSAMIYSICKTAKLNNLRPYFYFKHLLTELPKRYDNERNIDPVRLDDLLP